MSTDKAKALRKAFRAKFDGLAERYRESQSEKYPQAYRVREGESILKEIRLLEAQFQNDMIVWSHGQRIEVARLRSSDPVGDPATETRRLREQMQIADLAERYSSRTEARNHLIPRAQELLAAGNVDQARVYFEAARKAGVHDGRLERDLSVALDRTVPHRRQAVELDVGIADELELSRAAIAQAKVANKIGSQQEQVRASTQVKMSAFKREREAELLKRDLGIELPPASD